MQCPNCHRLVEDANATFCPHCGFEFAKWNERLLERLTQARRKQLLLQMGGVLFVSLAGILLSIWGPIPSIYIFLAVGSWYWLRHLARQIGMVDRANIPAELSAFLRLMGMGSILANLANIAIFVLALIAFF